MSELKSILENQFSVHECLFFLLLPLLQTVKTLFNVKSFFIVVTFELQFPGVLCSGVHLQLNSESTTVFLMNN